MREQVSRLFNNISIRRKLLLASAIPLAALILLSVVTFESVEKFLQDEEQLSSLYLAQNAAARSMRMVVDLESGFRGYVITKEPRYLQPYRVAQAEITEVGKDLKERVTKEQLEQFNDVEMLVTQLIKEKDELIEAVNAGRQEEALQYFEKG